MFALLENQGKGQEKIIFLRDRMFVPQKRKRNKKSVYGIKRVWGNGERSNENNS